MALINYATREINAKIVYYGPGLSGKTTNIQYVFKKVRPDNKGRLVSLATKGDRTLFFDFLPVELGNIRGFKTRFHLYTVPGQVFYNSTRKMVLKGSDGIVFVADSQKMMMDENLQSLDNLKDNLRDMGVDFSSFPMVLQYNKRDLPNAAPVESINERLNPQNLPYFEASAISGDGVLKTLTAIVKYVLHDLKETPDMHSLDFPAIEAAAGAVVGGASGAISKGVARPAAGRVPAAMHVAEAADTRPDITEPVRLDAAGRQVKREPAEAAARAGQEVSGTGADKDQPKASRAPGTAGDYEAFGEAEMIEGLGSMIAEAEKIPPREVSGDPYGLDDLHSEVPETRSGPATDDMPAGLVTDEQGQDIPDEFHPEMELASGLEVVPPDVYPTVGEAQETRPAVSMAVNPSGKQKPGVTRLKRTFKVPVRLDTPNGVKEVVLSLNVDVDITGDGLDAVEVVNLGQPQQVEDIKGTSMHEKDLSKHPPPERPAGKPANYGSNEPELRIYKKGIFNKMFGR